MGTEWSTYIQNSLALISWSVACVKQLKSMTRYGTRIGSMRCYWSNFSDWRVLHWTPKAAVGQYTKWSTQNLAPCGLRDPFLCGFHFVEYIFVIINIILLLSSSIFQCFFFFLIIFVVFFFRQKFRFHLLFIIFFLIYRDKRQNLVFFYNFDFFLYKYRHITH